MRFGVLWLPKLQLLWLIAEFAVMNAQNQVYSFMHTYIHMHLNINVCAFIFLASALHSQISVRRPISIAPGACKQFLCFFLSICIFTISFVHPVCGLTVATSNSLSGNWSIIFGISHLDTLFTGTSINLACFCRYLGA